MSVTFLSRNNNLEIDCGTGITWKIILEHHIDDIYMATFEQYEEGIGRTICPEQIVTKDALKDLLSLTNNVIEKGKNS